MALIIGAYALAAAAVGGSGYYLLYRNPSQPTAAAPGVELTTVAADQPKMTVVTAEDLKSFSNKMRPVIAELETRTVPSPSKSLHDALHDEIRDARPEKLRPTQTVKRIPPLSKFHQEMIEASQRLSQGKEQGLSQRLSQGKVHQD